MCIENFRPKIEQLRCKSTIVISLSIARREHTRQLPTGQTSHSPRVKRLILPRTVVSAPDTVQDLYGGLIIANRPRTNVEYLGEKTRRFRGTEKSNRVLEACEEADDLLAHSTGFPEMVLAQGCSSLSRNIELSVGADAKWTAVVSC